MFKNFAIRFPIIVLAIFAVHALAVEPPTSGNTTTTLPTATNPSPAPIQVRGRKLDCSHLVHALYENFGLSYRYTTSRVLYKGIHAFSRVTQPESGDLVVWQGHVGLVVDPVRHTFISSLNKGVRTACYVSSYWKHYGVPRFFRYAMVEKDQARADKDSLITSALQIWPRGLGAR
jgi:hypothetical protein